MSSGQTYYSSGNPLMVNQAYRDARITIGGAQNKVLTENQLRQAEIDRLQAANKNAKYAGAVSSDLAQQFFKNWNAEIATSKGIYNTALADITAAKGNIDRINQVMDTIGQDYTAWKETFAPVQTDLAAATRESIAQQGQLRGQFMDTSQLDTMAGARAKADVGNEFERARRAMELEQAAGGLAPNAGMAGRNMRGSRISEAISKVLANNQAKMAEKNRVAQLSLAGMQAIDPTEYAKTAATISGVGNQMLGMKGQLAEAGGNLAGSLANARANVASSYSRDIVAPQGEAAGAMLGSALSNNAQAMSQQMNQPNAPVKWSNKMIIR